MNRNKSFQELPTLLDGVLEKYHLKEQIKTEQIITNWEKLVGAKIANKCTPVEFSDQILIVRAKNETWRLELARRQGDLLNLVNGENKTPLVKKIKIV